MLVLDKHYEKEIDGRTYFIQVLEDEEGNKAVLAGRKILIDKFPEDVYNAEGISQKSFIDLFVKSMIGVPKC